MLLTVYQEKYPINPISKINYKFRKSHPLVRFITPETIALMFDLKIKDIYRIDCYQYVVYLHAKGISTFISYADFPPIIGVDKPKNADISRWKQRWRKKLRSKYAPDFWTEFYLEKLEKVTSVSELWHWENLLSNVKSVFSQTAQDNLFKKELPSIKSSIFQT